MCMNNRVVINIESTHPLLKKRLCYYHHAGKSHSKMLYVPYHDLSSLDVACHITSVGWLGLLCDPRGVAGRYMYIYAVNAAYQLSLCEVRVYPATCKYVEAARIIETHLCIHVVCPWWRAATPGIEFNRYMYDNTDCQIAFQAGFVQFC